jgi:hypothetical protein
MSNAAGFIPGIGQFINTLANVVDCSSQALFTAGFNAYYNSPNMDMTHLRPNNDLDASTYSGMGSCK